MYKGSLIIILALFLLPGICTGQTIYGVTGLIKTPNSYIVDTGKCVMGMAHYSDYQNNLKTQYKQWTLNFNIGFHSRVELGVRLAIFPGFQGDNKIYDASFDRIFNGKFILIKEKAVIPQISFGMQDIVGTRFHNSTYCVASKTIQIKNSFSILLNSGYGSKITDRILGDARNHNFIGFFGGTEIGFKKRIYLIAEYDARDVNCGSKVILTNWLNVYFEMINMEIPSGGLSLKFSI